MWGLHMVHLSVVDKIAFRSGPFGMPLNRTTDVSKKLQHFLCFWPPALFWETSQLGLLLFELAYVCNPFSPLLWSLLNARISMTAFILQWTLSGLFISVHQSQSPSASSVDNPHIEHFSCSGNFSSCELPSKLNLHCWAWLTNSLLFFNLYSQ